MDNHVPICSKCTRHFLLLYAAFTGLDIPPMPYIVCLIMIPTKDNDCIPSYRQFYSASSVYYVVHLDYGL